MAGGLAFLSAPASKLAAAPIIRKINNGEQGITEATFLAGVPMDLKARLNANENPFGPSPAAKKALIDSVDGSFRYAMKTQFDLSDKICKYEGITQGNIMMSNGSTPLLMAAAMHYSEGGKSIITGETSYEDLPSRAVRFGAKWVKVPLTADYKLDLDAMEAKVDASNTGHFICNLNNPTATVVDTDKLKGTWDGKGTNFACFPPTPPKWRSAFSIRRQKEVERIELPNTPIRFGMAICRMYIRALSTATAFTARTSLRQATASTPTNCCSIPMLRAHRRADMEPGRLRLKMESGDDLTFDERDSAPFMPKCTVVDPRFDWRGSRDRKPHALGPHHHI